MKLGFHLCLANVDIEKTIGKMVSGAYYFTVANGLVENNLVPLIFNEIFSVNVHK